MTACRCLSVCNKILSGLLLGFDFLDHDETWLGHQWGTQELPVLISERKNNQDGCQIQNGRQNCVKSRIKILSGLLLRFDFMDHIECCPGLHFVHQQLPLPICDLQKTQEAYLTQHTCQIKLRSTQLIFPQTHP